MATVVNFIDTTLQAAATRTVNLPTAQVLLPPSAIFHVTTGGVGSPTSLTFTPTLIDLAGTISFSCIGGTLTNVTATSADLTYANMTGASAVVTASVTVNGTTFTGQCTISKVTDGTSGTVAAYVSVDGQQVFSRATAAAAFAPTSITLTATPYGGTATYQWQYWTGSAWANVASAGTSATYVVGSGDFTDQRLYRVQATIGGTVYTDQFTMVQVTGGTSAVTGFLTNESVTLAADSGGTVSSFTPAGGTFDLYDGITDKTGTGAVTYSVASQLGCTVSIASTGVYSVSAMTADSASATLQAVYGSVTIQKVLSLAKSRAGAGGAGSVGPRGAGHWYATGSAWSDTVADATCPGGKVVSDVVTISNGTTYSLEKKWDGSTWSPTGVVIDGTLLVTASVKSAAIDTKGVIVRDNSGNAIVGIGVPLAAGYEATGTKNSDFSNGTLTIGGDNLAVNSSFELFSGGIAAPYDILNNTAGTEPTTGSSGVGRTGGLAWIVSWTGAHSGTKGIYGPVCKGGWLPGAQYVLSFYAKTSDLAAGVPFGLIWTVPPASAVSLSNPTITTSWQRYSFLLTWGSSVEPNGYAYMTLGAGGGTHGNVWFDDLMAVEGSVLPAYYQSTAEVQSAINDSTSGLAQKMRLNAANILSGSGGLTTGTLTYDTSGARTGGYGVAMNQKGIVGFNSSGAATVTVDASTGEIALGGNCVISLGQSAYNTGTGGWIQGGSTPKMSMKTASGATFLCDPANNVLSMNGGALSDPVINTPILATQSVGGMVNVSTTGANGISRSITRTANPSGGRAPYTFLWVETTAGGMIKLSNTTSATVTITANGSSETQTGVVACTATDANGIAISGSLSVAMTFA